MRVVSVVAALALVSAGVVYAVTGAVGGSSAPPAAANQSGPWLGIDVTTSPYGGVMVVNVAPGSPAYWAGMEAGDVITQIDGRRILAPSDVTSALAGMHPGQHVTIQFQGSGATYNAQVPLGNRPAGYP